MIHRRTRLLAHAFFGRLFENDMFSSSVAASASVTWMLAALATPGVMMSGSLIFYYAHTRTLPAAVQDRALLVNQAFHIDFVMAMAGLVTMLVWSSLTPDRRDAMVLGPLPLATGEQARARLLALLTFFAMFIAAVSVPTAVAFTFVTVGAPDVLSVPQRVAAHIGAAVLGGAFVYFTLVSVQLLLTALFGPRAVRLATWPLQIAAIAGMVGALAFTGRVSNAMLREGLDAGAWLGWNPAAWFVAVYRWLMGDHREVFAVLAARGAVAAAASATLAVVLYSAAYGRCLRHAIDSEGRRTGQWSRGWAAGTSAVLRPLLRTPCERALTAYMMATLSRSQPHRFLIGSYLGVGLLFALPLGGRLLQPAGTAAARYAWFSVPLGLLFWLVAGTRVATMWPVEPAANWIFKLTEPVDKRRVLTAAMTVMAAVACAPLAALFGTAAAVAGGATLGATVCGVVMLTGVCLIEALTLTQRAVPFTCTYLPGQLRLRVFWPAYFLIWYQITFKLPDAALWALGDAANTLQLVGGIVSVWVALRVWHRLRIRRIRAFVYDEQPPALVAAMDLAASPTYFGPRG